MPVSGSVLAAVVSGTEDRVRALLPGCDVTFVFTYSEAVAALERNRYAGVVISMRFDESRMFDLLKHVRATHPDTPAVCVRVRQGGVLSKVAYAATALAVSLLGGQAFFDVKDDIVKQKGRVPFERFTDGDAQDKK